MSRFVFANIGNILELLCKKNDNSNAWISILDFSNNDLKSNISLTNEQDHISWIREKDVNENFICDQDLIIISFENHKKLFQIKKEWLNNVSSVLICSKGKEE